MIGAASHLAPLDTQTPSTRGSAMSSFKIKCCCTRPDCPHLEHNTATLEELERDVEIAARLGQALLERHECYKSKVELDRARILSDMERLEKCKKEAEAENSRLFEENHGLTDQLDCLNQAVAESDTQIQTLTATLERTQLELRSLAACASRATQLEEELHKMERDRAHLQEEITITQEGEKNAIQRWKKAECGLESLHDQLDQMENETREERERNLELSKRMERKQMVGPVGGLKPDRQNRNKIGMASHFVGDILQENAKLQRFIVELKELLQNSDEEAQNLREQMAFHRPLDQMLLEKERYQGAHRLPLSEELRVRESTTQEVHVHHHYHNSTSASLRLKPRTGRPRLPVPHHQQRHLSAPPPFLLKPQKKKLATKRVVRSTRPIVSSVPITRAMNAPGLSSSPSSPRSGYRTSSIFDPFDELESSQPSSPEISNLTSPNAKLRHCESLSYASTNAISEIMEQRRPLSGLSYPRLLESVDDSEIVSVHEDELDKRTGQAYNTYSDPILIKEVKSLGDPSHRRNIATNNLRDGPNICSSSLSDGVKTLQPYEGPLSTFDTDSHKSNEVASTSTRTSLSSPHRISPAGIIFSTTAPIISKTNVVIPKASVPDDKTSLSLLSSAVSSTRSRNSEPPAQRTEEGLQKNRSVAILPKFPARFRAIGVGKRVSSWVHKQPLTQSKNSADDTSSVASSSTAAVVRPPGVNQNGPIFGLRPPNPAPTSVHVQGIDHVLLQESLLE